MENARSAHATFRPEPAALLAWEYEGGALPFVTRAAAMHALRTRIALATSRRDMLSWRLAPEAYLAADSIVSALEAQLDSQLLGNGP